MGVCLVFLVSLGGVTIYNCLTFTRPKLDNNNAIVRTINYLCQDKQIKPIMGRKSKLEIRLTDAEYAQLKGLAEKSKKTISDYCRELLGLSLSGQSGLVSVRTEKDKPVRTEIKKPSGQILSGQDLPIVRTEVKPKPIERAEKPVKEKKESTYVNPYSKEYMARKAK
jgi:hypothetical protein